MKQNRLGPVDIIGITLGAIAFVIVVASLAIMASNRPFFVRADMGGYFVGGDQKVENDEEVPGQFTEVEVRNVAGAIQITGRDRDGVGVHSEKTAPTQAALDALKVRIEPRGNRLVLEETREPSFMSRGYISFNISIPKGVKLIEAHSVSGSITVSNVQPGVDQVLGTVSGSVSTSESGDLDASSTSGSIEFNFAGKNLKAGTVSGSINGQIDSIEATGSVRLKSISGSVQVAAFPSLEASVALSSVSGSVSCGFLITIEEQKRNSLKGKIGSGAVPVDISTVSGQISISKK
jgi:DUF4097 and DUF4098 domain-containing protein YvlB